MRFTTTGERVKALQYIQLACDRRVRLTDAQVYRQFGIGDLVTKLLNAGVLSPTNTPKVYSFDASIPHEEIVSMIFKRSSSADLSEIVSGVNNSAKPEAITSNRISDIAIAAVDFCRAYGIEKEADFIRDALVGKITITQNK